MNADDLDPKPAVPEGRTAAMKSAMTRDEIRELAAPGKRPSAGLTMLALLLAALALSVAVLSWWQGGAAQRQLATQLQAQQQQQQTELQSLQQALASVQDAASQQSGSGLTDQLRDMQQRLQVLESTQSINESFRNETSAWTRSAQAAMEDTQARLNTVDERLRTLTARSAQGDSELQLEEIDYLLRLAQERLQLFGDTRNADRALQLADQQVVAFDNPMFISLRREIAAARQALAATDVPDMVTLAAEFDKLQDGLATLPFKTSKYETARQASSVEPELSWWQRLKSSLAGLVTVRRVADDELALPALADQQALRQRAWLQIEQARLAALSREQDIYLDALVQAEATVTRWFAADNAEVKLALSGLQALQQRNVDPPMPDISGPWTTLRSIREAGLSPTVVPAQTSSLAPAVSNPPQISDSAGSETGAADEPSDGPDDVPGEVQDAAEPGAATDPVDGEQ